MTDAISIALSGLTAQKQRLSVTASNIANISTNGPIPGGSADNGSSTQQVYKPLETNQTSVAISGEGAGVLTTVQERNNPYLPIYSPDSDFADSEGFIATPNIDIASEAVELMLIKTAYKANLATLKTANEMTKQLLDQLT